MTYKETFAWKAISVITVVATIVVLSGVVYLTQVFNVFAASSDGVVEDVTGTNPRIAADGESQRVVLGLNLVSGYSGTDGRVLDNFKVQLSSSDPAAEAAIANIEEVRIYRDSSLAGTNGVFDENDPLSASITRASAAGSVLAGTEALTNGAGDVIICVSNVGTTIVTGDFVKIGTGLTAEIRQVTTLADTGICLGGNQRDAWTVSALTYDHVDAEVAREVADETATGTLGFATYSSGTTVDVTAASGDWTAVVDVATDDSGNNAGNDIFVVLVTKDGILNQTVKAQVWSDVASSVTVMEGSTADASTAALSSASGTTLGESKAVTFGADGVAPSITSIETYDNTADGKVDRVKVYFNESMASGVNQTDQFESSGGTANEIEAGATDINLNATGIWSTTSVLNDTLTIDFADVVYTNNANSSGDTWSVTYDREDVTTDLRDATGQRLEDVTVTSVDKAKPYLVSAKVKDSNGNNKVDTLEVTFSESLGGTTTSSGLVLKETAVGTSTFTYGMGSVTGFKQSTMTDSNANDTVVVSLTERAEDDVTGTFLLDYTAGQTVGMIDSASNEAGSRTSVTTTLDVAPLVTRVQYFDLCSGTPAVDGNYDCTSGAPNGKIDTVKLTLSRAVDTDYTVGNAITDWTVAGYSTLGVPTTNANPSGANVIDATTTLYLRFTEKTFDTDKTPDLTYAKATVGKVCIDEANDADCAGGPTVETYLGNVVSADVAEEDTAGPVLRTATLYDTDSDTIWDMGETLQLLFSEDIASGSVVGSWANDTFTDWNFGALAANESPNSGTIAISGNLVTLTAGVSATSALSSNVAPTTNEVKDVAGNSAVATVTITVNPTTAPAVDRVETRDLDGNGIVDAVMVEFAGQVDASTLVAGDFSAARSSNFTFGDANSYSSTSEVTPDLVVTAVMTENGGNDTRVLVKFAEQNENTGLRPQVKYIQGSLKDLAGNLVSSFNQGTDNAKFATAESTADVTAAIDGTVPVVVYKLLKDRNMNGLYDQLVLVFSEAMDTTTTSATGWSVLGEALAASGTWSSNNSGTYDAYTFANSNNVFSVDIVESDAPTVVPSVSYASTGAFKDGVALPLASVAAGGEVSEISVAPALSLADGSLAREAGSLDIYIIKLVGTKMFKRLILNPTIFESYGHLLWSNVQDVAAGSLSAYTTSSMILEDGGTKVYNVSSALGADTGTKQWLNMTAAAFEACGYDWDSLYTVNSTEVSDSFYPVGADITSC